MPFYEVVVLCSQRNKEGELKKLRNGLFCEDEERVREIALTLPGVNRSHPEAIVSIQEIEKARYIELKCSRNKGIRKYFEIIAKGGHVGRDKYYECHFFVCAPSWQNAHLQVRKFPRVKKDHIDAIVDHKEISLEEFVEGSKEFDQDPYHHCYRKGQQKENIKEIKKNICKETDRVLTEVAKRRDTVKKKNNGEKPKRAYNRASLNKPTE